MCIRGFYRLGYEVGFARVSEEITRSSTKLTSDVPGILQFPTEG